MSLNVYLVLVCLCGLWWVESFADECPYQNCTCDPIQILCQSQGFKAIPPITLLTNITYELLFFDGNHISAIPAGSLLHNLKELSLLSNPIASIDDTAFDDSASTLEILTFSKAVFTRIPDAFLHLHVLKYLYIDSTDILDWNLNAMKNIGQSLNSLYLGNVSLTTWPSWIQYFTNLTELTITDSLISSIPDDGLDAFAPSLIKLSLIGNKLTFIPKSFSLLSVLQSLTVQQTDVSDVTWLPQSDSLSVLELATNKISDSNHLSTSLRHLTGSLKYLNLEINNLTSIPDLSFLIFLEDVNFNHNELSDPGFGSLPISLSGVDLAFNNFSMIPPVLSYLVNIDYLNLPRNSIKTLRGTDFPPATTIADFGYNLITELTDTSFPINSSLAILSFNNNPISSVSNMAFINLQDLSSLNLQYTKLTRLPLALSSLTHLSRLDISGNTDLVCTCMEKSLQPFILSIVDLTGNCEDVSIYYFFANLSPGCPVP